MDYSKQWETKAFSAPLPHARLLKVLMSPKTHTVKNLSVGMTLLPPGNTSSLHSHEKEEEIWYVISGRGLVRVGGEEMIVIPDILIYIPQTVKHQLINNGDETLKVLWIFSPAGPEEEFIK